MHLILVDASGFLHRAYHASHKSMCRADGTPIGGINSFCSMLWRLYGKLNHATHMVVIGDAGGKTWRHHLDPQYKAHRPEKEDGLKAQLAMMEDAVRAFGLPYIARYGKEADDIIGTYATRWTELVTVVSSDKDLMQLIDERVIMLEPHDEKFFHASEVVQKFGVTPGQMVDFLALWGDDSDNIKGVPGVGPKIAAKLLKDHNSVDGIYDNIAEVSIYTSDESNKRFRAHLLEHEIQARLAVKLVTLWRDVPGLPDPAGFAWQRHRDYRDLAAYCRSNGMKGLADRVVERWYA